MKILKKGRYILHAPWHTHHGKEVEILMKRKGMSPSYKGEDIYHIVMDPDEDFRSEDYDEEFVEKNFKMMDESICIIDLSRSTEELRAKFKPYFKRMKKAMQARINVSFVERYSESEQVASEYLCVFYLIDSDGKPALTLDPDDGGEILVINA